MIKNLIELAIDVINNRVSGNYSKEDGAHTLREALIAANGGETKINIKKFHRGNELFEIVEELIPAIIDATIQENEPIFDMIDYKNISAGDENEFTTQGKNIFVVADTAAGIQGVRRQRISGGESVSVHTTFKTIRVYENLGRLLAGRISFDSFVEGVAKSFKQAMLENAALAFESIAENTPGLSSTYVKTGSFDENKLLELVEHVEASTGKTARIVGTKMALRKITTAEVSDEAKTDKYNLGHYGKFYGTEMVAMKQYHKADGSTFVLNDNRIYVIAGDDKPIKLVNEGEGFLNEVPATMNADMTQEYVYGQSYGVGVICGEVIGVYNIG